MTRFPILAACLDGVPTDVIADSLSQGDSWALSDAEEAASALEIQLTAPVGSIATRLRALWQGGAM